jgi:ribonuclease-3
LVARHPIEEKVGYQFKDPSLIDLAFRHASVTDARVKSNERLEFLGDAVLGLIVCQSIYEQFPHLLEGEMTKIKSAVVSRASCAEIGKQINIEEHLAIGKGMKTQAALPSSLAAAAVEAIIAAIYLDGGLEPVRVFLMPLLQPRIERAAESGHQENFKSILQQYAQQRLTTTPDYVVLGSRGPDHSKQFQVCVEISGTRYEASWGASKKAAEQGAALNALSTLGLASIENGSVRLRSGLARAAYPGESNGK